MCGAWPPDFCCSYFRSRKRFARNDPIGRDFLQSGHFAANHVEFFHRLQEIGLHLQQVFVGQPNIKQRLARLDRLALQR